MEKDKVEVIIAQERYEELLEKEKQLEKQLRTHSIHIGYKYLDTRYAYNTLDKGRDLIVPFYESGNEVPVEIKDFVAKNTVDLIERVDAVNEYRLHKINQAVAEIKNEIKCKREIGRSEFSLRSWFNQIFGNYQKDNELN